ncbi:putative fungal-specific transcription factor [Talaromyces proteolyticus]|uniref:Fungal-specific transcription factor n=1 Tax=Talaromyces proteolyticus TaxID=1131652 RepID=A0AAD4KUC1_9EURO|nr:putative fungal-specific transcription factor [Talaromyces proteolyticus]KAH8698950.1 putative fungal-specific transcription factor [Talaromyces proteolyticus]
MSTSDRTHSVAESPTHGQEDDLSSRPVRPGPHPSRRRDKPQLSCNPCRRRKSRCDRQKPCSTCSARGQICTYPGNQTSTGQSELPRVGVHDRLVQLEQLVMSFVTDSVDKSNAKMSSDPDPRPGIGGVTPVDTLDTSIDARSECGSMRISVSEHRYVGEDHWAAILDRIADLKDHFDREEQQQLAISPKHSEYDEWGEERTDALTRPRSGYALLLYGVSRPASRDQILTALPPRAAVDRYISRYFNYLDLVSSSAVHGPSFLRQYEAFWTNPSGVPIMWIGLLFSIICLACFVSETPDSDNEQQSLQIDLYREKIVQCLVLGKYTQCGPYVLETVINYLYTEFCIHSDAHKDTWFLLALEVNLAMRMGYHRDPSYFPGISPFYGEMRRRLWATVLMGDILISNQMGMPRMICDWKWDTTEPRSLNDADFDEDTVELPPSRPESEHTTSLGLIARRRILKALGNIADLTNSVQPCSYAEVMRVDGILEEAAQSIPQQLKMKPMAASLTDIPQVIISRLFLGHIFYGGKIMLHRRLLYMQSPSQEEDPFIYSRRTCLDACLGTLEIQNVLDEETCPGGQLYTVRFRVTSVMNHQFLTATMILCSMLCSGQTQGREDEVRSALQRSRMIWIRRSTTSKEAKKAAETVSIVLAKAGVDLNKTTNDWMMEIGGLSSNQQAMQEGNFVMGLDGGGMFTDSTCMDLLQPLDYTS